MLKSNNPANHDSQSAKESGLSYWEYMEKTYHRVYHFVWGTKKQNREQKRAFRTKIDEHMARSANPRMRFLSQMKNLLGGRSY